MWSGGTISDARSIAFGSSGSSSQSDSSGSVLLRKEDHASSKLVK
jgi:hypothetical protein